MVTKTTAPIIPCCSRDTQERHRSHHIGICKSPRIFYGAVNVTLSSKIYHILRIILLKKTCERRSVAYVYLLKDKTGISLVSA